MAQDEAGRRTATITNSSSPPFREDTVGGHHAAAAVASALSRGAADGSALRHVERCTEASCGQRTAEASLLRIVRGLTGPDPPDRLELGQCSWALLHTSAAFFPREPTTEEKERTRSWLNAFFKLYPCTECRSHIAPYVKNHPIDAEDSGRLSAWLCNAHNYVNRDLDKELYCPCDGETLRLQYRASRIVRRPDLS